MEKLISQIEVDEGRNPNISKSMVKGKLKSLRKVSKTYRAMQLIKYKAEIYTYNFIKRAVDICAGIFGSILLLPIMAVVKIAYLKQGDHAPVLFKQKRIGKMGKKLKF